MGMGAMEPLFNEDFDLARIPPIAIQMPKGMQSSVEEQGEQLQSPHEQSPHEQVQGQGQGWMEQGYGQMGGVGEKYGMGGAGQGQGQVEVMEMEMPESEDPFLSSMSMGASSMSWDMEVGMEGY